MPLDLTIKNPTAFCTKSGSTYVVSKLTDTTGKESFAVSRRNGTYPEGGANFDWHNGAVMAYDRVALVPRDGAISLNLINEFDRSQDIITSAITSFADIF